VTLGEDSVVQISSYINNLHPVHHENLYNVVEQFIAKSLSLWATIFNSLRITASQRVIVESTEYEYPDGASRPHEEGENSDDDDAYELDEQWVCSICQCVGRIAVSEWLLS
jgi:hypothetical protein